MKVAMVTSFPADPDTPHGGVEAVSVNLVRAMAKMEDVTLHVVTTDRQCGCLVRSQWNKATIHRLPWVGGRELPHAIGPGRRQIQKYLAWLGADVIHAHDTYGLMVQGMPGPRVFTVHGFIHCDTLIEGRRFAWLRSRLWRRAERACWAEQPHIVSISPYVRERLRGIATGVIHDIDNPIAAECFEIRRRAARGTIFSAALICPRKNTLGLVEAFARVVARGVDARLRLAGGATDCAYEARVRQSVREAGLADRVAFLGPVSAARVREELGQASVFALVSLEEGAPMGVAEAMAAGVPVVTSNRCGMPYMLRHGESGFLVDPVDSGDIAGRLTELLQDDGRREGMGACSREIAMDRFHPDRVARRTLEVYRRAMESGAKGGRA